GRCPSPATKITCTSIIPSGTTVRTFDVPKERSMATTPSCTVVRPGETYEGKQGLTYVEGISAESVGSTGICMHLLTIPPGGRANAHLHEAHETAIYIISGESE